MICTATITVNTLVLRCTLHHDHDGPHRNTILTWEIS